MPKPTVHLVHGFNVSDCGQDTIAKLAPFVERFGYNVRVFSYPWRFLVRTKIFNEECASDLLKRVKDGDLAVAHSNGCTIVHRATWRGAPLRGVSYINPALYRYRIPGPNVDFCHVWHSPSDPWVRLAAMVQKLPVIGSLLMPDLWGAMGAYGYQNRQHEARDDRIVNFNKEKRYESNGWRSDGHSDVFNDDKLKFFGRMIAGHLHASSHYR